MTIKVAIAGARGRLGSAALQSIMKAPNMEVVAVLDYKYEGQYLHNTGVDNDSSGIPIYTSLENLAAANKPDVLLDLTNPNAVFKNVHDAISHGIRPVIGTSGLSKENIALLTELAAKNQVGGIIAPNFSIGAVLDDEVFCHSSPLFRRYRNT